MAFQKKTWVDRIVEFAGRRRLKNILTDEEAVYDVTRNEGNVLKEGDAFSAATMNDLEQRIADSFAITRGVLPANATSITLRNPNITSDCVLSFYVAKYGVDPTAVSVAPGSVTLTFDAQQTSMEVGVRVD